MERGVGLDGAVGLAYIADVHVHDEEERDQVNLVFSSLSTSSSEELSAAMVAFTRGPM